MNYIGSKYSLLNFLDESISKVVDSDCKVFCDLFAGTSIVGSYFKKKGYSIIANDIQYYSYVLNKHYIENHNELTFDNLTDELPEIRQLSAEKRTNYICEYLSNLEGRQGFIYNNYCPSGNNNPYKRQYFSDENGLLCDSIRYKIENWKLDALININEYYFLLASLIESVDKNANTASVYGAYLKHIKKTALKRFELKPAEIILNDKVHKVYKVYNEDINKLIGKIEGDIVYLDPPYNHRQYATNYHILETIARYDSPIIKGKTGLREYDSQKSEYCSKPKALIAFKYLIENIKAKYIFLSYNNEGILSLKEIKDTLSQRGEYGCFTKAYNRFKADRDENRNYSTDNTLEYLHYVKIYE